jgi:hypothetical protein
MGVFTKAKLKSLNPNHLPESWSKLDDNNFILIDGKLVLKPMVHKRTIKPLIFI